MAFRKTINKDFFKVWSGDMAYVLGFMFADGNMVKSKQGGYYIAIDTADEELLVRIRTSMESKHKISHRKGVWGGWYVIQIGSKEMFIDLINLGLTPNKSMRIKMPMVADEYFGDFVRGFFDGDGNVWTGLKHKERKNPTVGIISAFTTASEGFLASLLYGLKSRGIKGGSIFKVKNKGCFRLNLSREDSLKLYEIMYNRPNTLYLARKKSVFDKYIVLTK